jgi:hypothetical protein
VSAEDVMAFGFPAYAEDVIDEEFPQARPADSAR